MATIKKNQLANIVFPMVDGVDFATVESGLTASDFESKITKKYFGVTHGNSTAFTSGTISKTITLVRSGIFQQTLKAAETNFDYVMYAFLPNNTSLAQQMLVFQPVDYDDSDIFSQLSDIGSNLLSYLTGISGAISDVESQLDVTHSLVSDVDSQLLLNASVISDVQSALDSQFLIITSNISDVDSQLLLNASVISDIQSALDSQFLVITSNLSDVESQVDLLATSNYLSQVHSDLRSQIGGITATVSASDISDIASRVWAEKYTAHSAASSFGSLFSDVFSRLALTQSNVSDIQSALDSQFTYMSNAVSDMHSDLRSQISGITATVSASDISDIASAVWADTIGARVDSRILLIQSNVSDVESAIDAGVPISASDMSDIRSAISAGPAATVTASDISDIASAVWAAKYTTHSAASSFGSLFSDVYSRLVLTQSNVSDIDSQLTVTHSLVSDIDSQLLLNASVISDVYSLLSDHDSNMQSRVTKAVATNSQLSDLHSDLRSYLVGISGAISDVDSQLTVTHSLVSDIDSQLLLNASVISDIDSQLTVTHSLVSDIDSQLTVNAGNISDIQTRLPAALVSGRMSADAVAISGSTAAADNLEASAEVIIIGTAQTGTLSTTQMSTDLTEATNDHYIGRAIIWTSGALLGQATDITDYVGTNGVLTFTAVTEAPSNGDTFVIV